LRFQIETSSYTDWGGTRYLPHAFTEQGVAMLSGIINSKKAIQMNIAIMRAFVELRRILLIKSDFKLQLDLIKDRLSGYDAQLNQIYDAIENIMDETEKNQLRILSEKVVKGEELNENQQKLYDILLGKAKAGNFFLSIFTLLSYHLFLFSFH
jgi:hypothetical protein